MWKENNFTKCTWKIRTHNKAKVQAKANYKATHNIKTLSYTSFFKHQPIIIASLSQSLIFNIFKNYTDININSLQYFNTKLQNTLLNSCLVKPYISHFSHFVIYSHYKISLISLQQYVMFMKMAGSFLNLKRAFFLFLFLFYVAYIQDVLNYFLKSKGLTHEVWKGVFFVCKVKGQTYTSPFDYFLIQ